VLLPAAAEPHAHLDKALTADLVPNPRGDLLGAIDAYAAFSPSCPITNVEERAERAARMLLANGITAIRTHVDVWTGVGTKNVEALVHVRDRLAGLVDIQIVALTGLPTTGLAGADNRAVLRDAMRAGADVVGGCPHLDPEPDRCQRYLLELAGELGLPIDLHTDESLSDSLDVRGLADWVTRNGFRWGVTASHCVSLGMQPVDVQRAVAAEVAAAGVNVVALPQTNLFLQGRGMPTATPRGLTALRPLLDAGATVAAGGDNLQDPFNTMGRGDPCEIASLMVVAGHLGADEAWHSVSAAARRTMGLLPVVVEAGSPAELVAIPASSLRHAIASAAPGRVVFRRGQLVHDGR
jgi:cytosine/creatinine deaminase